MKDEITKVQSLIANNNNLDRLEAKLNEFNSFKVLNISNHEIRHSNILAWLLDPKGNHNLGDLFLKKFLSEAIVTNENIDVSINVFDIQTMSYSDLEVKREWNNVDILLVSKQNQLAVLIENKINSNESKGQLSKYYEIVRTNFNKFSIVPLFLTLNNAPPSQLSYGTISHARILSIIKFISSIKKESLSSKVYEFIQDYIKTLEILTMNDDEIKSLCTSIYKEHKEALDLIWEYAEDTEFYNAGDEFIKNIEAKQLSDKSAWFLPKEFISIIKKIGIDNYCEGYPFTFWFSSHAEKIGFVMEVGPFKEENKRHSFLRNLKKFGFNIREHSFKPGAQYTRIFSKYSKFEDWDNKETIINKMDELYSKSAKEPYKKLMAACKNFKW